MELRKVNTPDRVKTENTTSQIHKNHRSRLKFQFENNGIGSLTDIQKLELLLFYAIPQKDTNPLAHALIDEFGSLKNVFSADINDLKKVKGIKENSATLIKLVGSLQNQLSLPSNDEKISSSSEACAFCQKLYTNVDVEQFFVICLTKSNKVKKVKMIGSGTLDEINVQIREITAFAIESKCNRIIVSHNHPAGIAKASDEDAWFTYSLVCSCLLNSIDILDHVIVGTDKAIAMSSTGLLQKLKERAFKTIKITSEIKAIVSSSAENYKVD